MAELLDRYRLQPRFENVTGGGSLKFINNLSGIIKEAMPNYAHIPSMKTKSLYIGIVLILIGMVVLGMSVTTIRNSPKAMLGIVLGGVLVQAGIAAFAFRFSEHR